MLIKYIIVLLLALDSITCQQCDVVLTSQADLKKEMRNEIANALSNFTLHDNGSSSVSQGHKLNSISEEVSTLREEIKKQVNDLGEDIKREMANLRQEVKLLLQPGHSSSYPADSCADILEYNNQSPSGYYWVLSSRRESHRVYCDMTRTCGGVTGGWRKVAELDMTDNSNHCPSTLSQRTVSNKRICRINTNYASCAGVTYSTDDIRYSKVCRLPGWLS